MTIEHTYSATWELIPELSFYQEGEAPQSGLYEISVHDNVASFSIKWTTIDGEEKSIDFAGPLDGKQHDVEQSPGVKASYIRVNSQTLDSKMYMNDIELAYARRLVSNDGTLMAVLQTGIRPDGSSYRNTQVYRKI